MVRGDGDERGWFVIVVGEGKREGGEMLCMNDP